MISSPADKWLWYHWSKRLLIFTTFLFFAPNWRGVNGTWSWGRFMTCGQCRLFCVCRMIMEFDHSTFTENMAHWDLCYTWVPASVIHKPLTCDSTLRQWGKDLDPTAWENEHIVPPLDTIKLISSFLCILHSLPSAFLIGLLHKHRYKNCTRKTECRLFSLSLPIKNISYNILWCVFVAVSNH